MARNKAPEVAGMIYATTVVAGLAGKTLGLRWLEDDNDRGRW